MTSPNSHKRVLLKLSGEALMGSLSYGLDPETVERICRDVVGVHKSGIQVCVVVGAGNIFRGVSGVKTGIDRATADYMGMLATVMNALALQSMLERLGVEARVQSAFPVGPMCEPYERNKALRHLDDGRVVVFGAGTGNPYFTTDTAAALRAVEMNCDALLKGTQVDGVYSADPKKDPNAQRFDTLSYGEVLARDLKVMDTAAVAVAREGNMPILVFSIHNEGALAAVLRGDGTFTRVE